MRREIVGVVVVLASLAAGSSGCGAAEPARPDAGTISLGDAGYVADEGPPAPHVKIDGGFGAPDGSVIRADRFITTIMSFTPGDCAGFGAADMPDVIQGPPLGAGDLRGSLDVLSLGLRGEIVLGFEANPIVDGPGPDFLVFENAFFAGGDPSQPAADLAEVSVSLDGVAWTSFPCAGGAKAPFGTCAGWHPVYASSTNGISPLDPERAGGDPFDLAAVGLSSARYVRIRDLGAGTCEANPKPTNAGFDLDALAILHPATP